MTRLTLHMASTWAYFHEASQRVALIQPEINIPDPPELREAHVADGHNLDIDRELGDLH